MHLGRSPLNITSLERAEQPTASFEKWRNDSAGKRMLGVVVKVCHPSICEAGQEDHKVQIFVDYLVRLSQGTNKQEKEKKVTDGSIEL